MYYPVCHFENTMLIFILRRIKKTRILEEKRTLEIFWLTVSLSKGTWAPKKLSDWLKTTQNN